MYELDAEGEWILERKLLAHYGIPGEEFGACLAFNGDRLIVGTWAWLGEGNHGSAWAYDRSDGSWQEDVPLAPSQVQTPDSYAFHPQITTPSYFGWGLVASGIHALTTSGLQGAPDAAQFLRQGSDSWEVVQSLEPSEQITPALFGYSCAIDGGLAAIGDPYGIDSQGVQGGVVHIYEFDEAADQWELADLWPSLLGAGAALGASLDVQADTGTIVSGAYALNDGEGGVLVFGPAGSFLLEPPVPGLDALFGGDLSIHGDLLAVSEWNEREDGSPNEVHIYRIEETGGATLLQSIPDPRPGNGLNSATFGYRMELLPGRLLVGSPFANDEIELVGAVYSFIDNGSGFELEQILTSGTPAPGNFFGAFLDADDDLLVVNELGADDLGYNSGVNWVFERIEQKDGSSNWVRCAKLIDPLSISNGLTGFPALSGNTVLTGSLNGTGAAPNTGNISVYNDIRRSYWTGPLFGNWSDDANWTPVPPDNARASVFSYWPYSGIQAVTLDEMTMHVPQFRVELSLIGLDLSSGLHYMGNDSSDHLVVKGASSMGDSAIAFLGFGTFLVRGDILVGDDEKSGYIAAYSESIIAAQNTWRQGSLGQTHYALQDYSPGYATFNSVNAPQLAGTLTVSNPFNVDVQLGDTYNIFGSNEIDGPLETHFDIVSLPGLAPGLVFRLHYGADAGRGTETIVSIEVEEFNSLVGFQEPDSYDIQDGAATDVATIDLTGDGADEIAVCVAGPGGSPGQLYVFINDGMGGFASQDIYPLGSEPASIAAGDFEGDGWIDLAVSNYQDDEVRIYRNDGDGTGMLTEDTTPLAVGVGPLGIAAKDFNDDGADDLIVCCSEDRTIELYEGLNVRNRSRAPSQKVTTPGKPQDVDPEDVVKPKFGNVGATTNDPDEIITMNVGTDGSLADPVGYPSGDNPGPITSEDIDGDGKSDFVATNQDDGSVTVLKQSAGRGYDPPFMLPLGATAGSLTIVDIEGDGDQDIVAVVDDGDGPIAKLLRNDMNLYNGELLVFADAEPLQTDVDPVLVDSGDIDQDGFADLVTIGESNQRSRGGAPSTMETHPNQRCSGDVNGDYQVDILDLLSVLDDWGTCQSTDCPSDLNLDGSVGMDDLIVIIESWGSCNAR
ncbi:MAG: FG-GAP-like repeat-containing protein [Planctomycetota bacterium]|nr:FG-GAP-like repeat-containing protein [Planctomycetota bacterium]